MVPTKFNFWLCWFWDDAAINLYYQDWYQYDPTIDSWTQKQNYPYALSYTSSFLYQ